MKKPIIFLVFLLLCQTALPSFAQETARYRVLVEFDWTTDGRPENPHWSRAIAIAHSGRYSLFRDGDTASSGLALLATNGRLTVLEAELDEGRRRGRVGEHVTQPGIEGVGTFIFEIELSKKHSLLSFATMLAPSPDWFSGFDSIEMQDTDGNWRERHRLPLWVWDAGADSGREFQSDNDPTQPRQSVRLLVDGAFLKEDGLKPIGQAIFERILKDH